MIPGKLVIIGDVHGRDTWKTVIDKEKPDKVCFIGDYWDSFDISYIEQLHNFNEIIKRKEADPDMYDLCMGNHDYHYMASSRRRGEYYSGYQSAKAMEIGELIDSNVQAGNIQMCHKYGDIVCTHAGLTQTWMADHDIDWHGNFPDQLNELIKEEPEYFTFAGTNGHGDDITQGPMWVRPGSLIRDSMGLPFKQVVGHTGVSTIGFTEGQKHWFIDCLFKGEYLILDSGDLLHGVL